MQNPFVDEYLELGCGRCSLYKTPNCKVHFWPNELRELRKIVLECGLTEEVKWGAPCYTFQEKNILMVTALKDFACISFFKGTLLNDSHQLLSKPGPSSQAARYIRFTSTAEIHQHRDALKTYITQAIQLEQSGAKVEFKKDLEPVPEELQAEFNNNQALKEAFYALTPGRQRGYIIHFSQPKKAATRMSRIHKYIPKILSGKGFFD
ncbi:MAG: YdeI/OmpD-associated family protein [Bacteroidota bacterium]